MSIARGLSILSNLHELKYCLGDTRPAVRPSGVRVFVYRYTRTTMKPESHAGLVTLASQGHPPCDVLDQILAVHPHVVARM